MKKRIMCLSLGLCLTLSGCTGIRGSIEQQMLNQAGIADDGNYQTYQAYNADGKLTQQGYYSEEVFEEEAYSETTPDGTALLSFAKNSSLEISYFTNAEKTELINTQSCHLTPGATIYATVEINPNISSSMYSFTGFRLYQFKNGKRTLVDTIQLGADGLILSIDAGMVGADYSLEPIGDYGSRVVTLRDYYADEDGTEHNLSGKWLIDDKEITGDEIEVNPVASYIISYEYDNNEYFYLTSSPECYYSNHEDGIVIFELAEPTDSTCDYSIQLHKYLSVNLSSSVDRTVSINGGTAQIVRSSQRFTLDKLKYGDYVTITTNKEWPEVEKCRDIIVTASAAKGSGVYEYTITIPQKGGEFVFDPSEYSYEHGTIIFKCFGEVVTNTQYLAKGAKISYSVGSVDSGYWLPDGEHTITVGNEEETRSALNAIRFEAIKTVSVSLPQPVHGGTIKYFVDGKEIKTDKIETTSGTVVTMEFYNWSGWIVNYINEETTYTVTDSPNQTILLGTSSVDTAFTESDDHKPTLEVVLQKSVGEKMTFSVSAADLPKVSGSYKGNWVGSDYVILEPTKIATYEGINLTFGNRALEAGTAIKILVETEDKSGNKTSYSRLVNNLAEKQAPILIYTADELGVSEVWYKSVKITISVVAVETFTAPRNPSNGTITVRVADTQQTLKNGDLIEPSEKITVTITPNFDYYVTGKNVKNDIYQETMKFSDYLKKVTDILTDHPIEKYIHLTLTASDLYGFGTYTLDNEEVSGSIRVKNGQTLKLTYKVTAEGYIIEGGSGGFLGIGKTDKEKTESLSITSDWDGKTIDKSSFGINVVKEE